MAYKGRYKLQKPEKYVGDPSKVTYRSSWERAAFRWCENNSDVIEWASEEIVIPYFCETDKKRHRYFIDLYIKMKNGKQFIIEIKPKKETMPPKAPKRRTKRFISEQLTFVKNQSKWKAAQQFAADNGITFQVWTEDTLRNLGMKII